MTDTTIYVAENVITMNPSRPSATAVAVRDGRVLGAGDIEELNGWGSTTIDETFEDKVLLPGFVEAHSHAMGGALWSFPYIGYYDRTGPDGTHWAGCQSMDEVVDRLQVIESDINDSEETLTAWGVAPIYFDEDNLTASELDRVSETRPIFVLHLNGHVASVNSALMEQEGITSDTDVEGVEKDADGNPTGILREPQAQALAGDAHSRLMGDFSSEEIIWRYGRGAKNSGCTTVGELGGPRLRDPEARENWQNVVNDSEFPVRVSMAYADALSSEDETNHEQVAQFLSELSNESTDKLRFGIAKLFLHGSIQGFSARLQPPHYYSDKSNGIWTLPSDEEEVKEVLLPYHEEGLTIYCHCNGDEASGRFINAVEKLQDESPRSDHRHTIQHCQMATADQYRRMATLGICANLFSNHIYYYGDQHYEKLIGPERAEQLDACATAKRNGVPFTVHSDAPVTPMGPLHTAWCAVNRVTSSGRVLGKEERISVEEALKTITLEPHTSSRWTMRLGVSKQEKEPISPF